jgi:DNA-binding HxlR family transcriptional regulator
VYPQVPPKVEYELTEMGKALGPSMAELIDWAYMRRERLADQKAT